MLLLYHFVRKKSIYFERNSKMKILNIHGYKSSGRNSSYEALKAIGKEAVSLTIDYDALSPDEILEMLCREAKKSGAEVVIGSSLGGFFAALISVRLGLPAVLINPCLMPFLHLPRLGYEGDIRPFMQLFGELSEIDEKKVYTIVGGSDEVIDTHDMTRSLLRNTHFEVVPNGGHSGSTLPLERFFSKVLSNS